VKCAAESTRTEFSPLEALLHRVIGTAMPTQWQILVAIREGLDVMTGDSDPMTMKEIIMLVDLAINHEENT